jgi:hypothetical protein
MAGGISVITGIAATYRDKKFYNGTQKLLIA